jgi:competence protein ComEC
MIFLAAIGFISGIALASLFYVSSFGLVSLSLFTLVLFLNRYRLEGRNKLFITYLALLCLSLVFGIVRVSVSDLYKQSSLKQFEQKQITAEGVVVSEPDVRETNTKLTIKLLKVIDGGRGYEVNEKILLTTSIYPDYKYGDKLRLDLKLEQPKNFSGNSDERVFDYVGYLRVREIWYTSRFAKISLLSSGNGNTVKTMLFKTKNVFTHSIQNVLPEPESSLLSGLLLGSKQSLGKDLLDEFQKTGVSHIVVLSGYNIAIVAKSVMSLLKFLPNNFSFGLGALSVILFTILSGGGASSTRAAIMVLTALFAKHFNREYKANRILGFTVVLMLAPNPLLLVFDPSFQLSVLATIGIIFVTPILEPYFKWVTEKYGLREVVSSTVSTQFTVLPFLIYNTGILSLVSLPVNILILGTIPLTMFLGFITGAVGLVSYYLSVIPALATYVLLKYQLTIIHIGSSIPFGAITLPAFSFLLLIFIYILVFFCLFHIKQKNR